HDPEGDSLAVGISDETLRIMDGFQVRCGEVGARQAGCIVGSEDHLADREAAGCALEAAAHASKGWIGRGGGVPPSTRSGRGKARLPDLAAIPKTGHRNAQ